MRRAPRHPVRSGGTWILILLLSACAHQNQSVAPSPVPAAVQAAPMKPLEVSPPAPPPLSQALPTPPPAPVPPKALAPATPPLQPPGKLASFHFEDADLEPVVRTLADLAGINIVLAPGVKVKVTLWVDRVPSSEAFNILQAILEVNNLVAIKSGPGELYDRYRSQVFRTALAITADRDAAADILQEVFLKLHRYAERIDRTVLLAPWLYRVTANLCYTHISRRGRWLTALEDAIENMVAPPGRTYPEHQIERGELQHVIRQAIDSLSPSQKIVIVLHYLADLNLKDIADILEVPEGTIKSRLYYGRENLRRKLASSRVMSPEVSY